MNILFITSTRIGDAVLSSGLLDHLGQIHKEARITVACGPLAAPLFADAPGVVRVIALEKKPFAGHWFKLWRQVVTQSWDLVVDLRSSAMAWLLVARQRQIFHKGDGQTHRVAQLAALLSINPPPSPKIHAGVVQFNRAAELIPDGGPVLAVGPTANWVGKQWAGDRFAETIDGLTGPKGVLSGSRIAVFGAGSERPMAQKVLAAVPQDRLIDLVGEVDILTAGACLGRCVLYLGNDSGLMHLAGAVGIPVVGLFGPSRDVHYAPWGDSGVAVRGPRSYDQLAAMPGFDLSGTVGYMDDLGVTQVIEAAEALLQKTGAARSPSEDHS
jgi:ADP-heptose:LPS heptosyltransferase